MKFAKISCIISAFKEEMEMKKTFLGLLLASFTLLYAGMDAFLEPEQAFKPSLEQEGQRVKANIALGEGIYVYKNKIDLKVVEPKDVKVAVTLPKGEMHEGFEGPEEVYKHLLTFSGILSSKTAESRKVTLQLSYQGCSEQGLCYQPMDYKKTLIVDFTKKGKSESLKSETKVTEAATDSDNEYETVLKQGFLAVIGVFFLGGILLAFTPCVFPMIPILSSLIVSQGDKITPMRAFFLSSVYVLAMAFAYTIAGVLAGLFGGNLQAAMQTPAVIVIFSLIFVALALSMFGFYEIKMPNFIQNAVTKKSQEVEGSGVWGIAVMGFLSALIVGPCMAAPLAGALAYIGDTGDAVLGGVALFSLSIGMGLPLIIVGVGAGKFMPKPGGWMDKVTATFGVIMLAVAIWMLDRVVDQAVTLFLFSILLIISSVAFGTFEALPNRSGGQRFFKGIGIVVFLLGLVYFIGAFTGGSLYDPLKAISSGGNSSVTEKKGLNFTQSVTSIKTLDAILKKHSKPVMLDFTASWCNSCKEFEELTFKDDRVVKAMNGYLLVHADITTLTDDLKALMAKYKVNTAPGIRFFDKEGREMVKRRIDWYHDADAFLAVLSK